MHSKYDSTHIAEIIADREAVEYNWTNAYIIRFLNVMLSKCSDEHTMATLYSLWREQMHDILVYWDWPEEEITKRFAKYNLINYP